MSLFGDLKFTRRGFITTSSMALCPTAALGQVLSPLDLRLVRRSEFEEMMYRNRCIISDVYVARDFPLTDRGQKICTGLELPWRNNLNEISCIPVGMYKGHAITGGDLGWRIALSGVSPREHVRIHVGNKPSDIEGCILLGTGNSTDAQCFIGGSVAAFNIVRSLYGNNNSRELRLLIE